MFYQFQVPTKVMFQAGLARDFAHECLGMGLDRLFLVTDQTLLDLGICRPILDHLTDSGIEITGTFRDVPPDSSVSCVEACANKAKESGAQGFLAIGGGSVLDTAKGANILFSLGGDLREDYCGAQTITDDLAPLIAIPTTAGTGSEVTEAIVIYDEESKTKMSFVDHHLLPTMTILDPELTVGLPPLLTAATAMDALTHAMEAIMGVQRGPVSDSLALQAIRLIQENIVSAVEDGQNLEARGALLTASNLAGIAFNHSMVGVVHSVAHSMGALCHIHHGTANGVFLPFGLEYNRDEVPNEIAKMATCFDGTIPESAEDKINFVIEHICELIVKLKELCGFPETLSEAGVKEDQLEKIAELAEQDGSSFYNPRPVEKDEILKYLKKAF